MSVAQQNRKPGASRLYRRASGRAGLIGSYAKGMYRRDFQRAIVAMSAVAALSFSMGSFFAAGVLILIGGFFDLVDGVVARHNDSATRFGAFLDSTVRVTEQYIKLARKHLKALVEDGGTSREELRELGA